MPFCFGCPIKLVDMFDIAVNPTSRKKEIRPTQLTFALARINVFRLQPSSDFVVESHRADVDTHLAGHTFWMSYAEFQNCIAKKGDAYIVVGKVFQNMYSESIDYYREETKFIRELMETIPILVPFAEKSFVWINVK